MEQAIEVVDDFLKESFDPPDTPAVMRSSVHSAERALGWVPSPDTQDPVAQVEGDEIKIGLHPVSGRGLDQPTTFRQLSETKCDWAGISDHPLHLGSIPSVPEVGPEDRSRDVVPIIAVLVGLLEPRRYVELGVATGEAFFAACEAGRGYGSTAECIAIDAWADDSEWCNFRNLAETRFRDMTHYIRGRLEDALSFFEDGSIDFLHVSPLVINDGTLELKAWLRKMSDRGVVVVQYGALNASEMQSNWKDLESSLPVWRNDYFHLGLAYVGTFEGIVAETLNWLRDNPSAGRRLTQLFNLFCHSQSVIAQQASALEVEKRKRQDAKDQLSAVKRSTMWRVTSPVRLVGSFLKPLLRAGSSKCH
ncbi:class I SAM-dependent methyltransferase [Methyloceanibacter marginalis]|uniref:class I SAM-dependent methyltransferase n=1 Tax=Methyloceanibacter marginalis TaxID=1774971 RepID=UPI0009F4DB24|nr:class I SAM-dependent methyltransferase [Methyloceanibacter marginalis]